MQGEVSDAELMPRFQNSRPITRLIVQVHGRWEVRSMCRVVVIRVGTWYCKVESGR